MKKVRKQQLTVQQRVAKMEDQMWQQVQSYMDDPEELLQYVKFLEQFHQYSIRNRMLVIQQRPGALALGSFKFYQQHDVRIKKGEKGLKIFVPTERKTFLRQVENGTKVVSLRYATKQEKELIKAGKLRVTAKRYFILGTVFDVTQTNLPRDQYPKLFPNLHVDYQTKASYDHDQIVIGVNQIIGQLGVTQSVATVENWDEGTAKGYYAPATKTIVLNPSNTPTENDAVLLHELGHAILHSSRSNVIQQQLKLRHHQKMSTAERELEAEMVAYLVSAQMGIDTTASSLRYIATWTDNGNAIARERLMTFFDEIVKVATYVVNCLQKTLQNQPVMV